MSLSSASIAATRRRGVPLPVRHRPTQAASRPSSLRNLRPRKPLRCRERWSEPTTSKAETLGQTRLRSQRLRNRPGHRQIERPPVFVDRLQVGLACPHQHLHQTRKTLLLPKVDLRLLRPRRNFLTTRCRSRAPLQSGRSETMRVTRKLRRSGFPTHMAHGAPCYNTKIWASIGW